MKKNCHIAGQMSIRTATVLLAIFSIAVGTHFVPMASASDSFFLAQGQGYLNSFGCTAGSGYVSVRALLDGDSVTAFSFSDGNVVVSGNGDTAVLVNSLLQYPECSADAITITSISFNCDQGKWSIVGFGPSSDFNVDGAVSCQPVDGTTCFTYNPAALTNACFTPDNQEVDVPEPVIGSQPTTQDVPTVTPTLTPTSVCVIGNECVPALVPGVIVGSEPVTVDVPTYEGNQDAPVLVPLPSGYVEATVLCPAVGQDLCRVTL